MYQSVMCPRFISVLTTAHFEKLAVGIQNMEHPGEHRNTGKGKTLKGNT
jgi:hypothetical protein